jgi:uncharacterized protein
MEDKLSKLRNIIEDMGSVLVAFSGGLDSSFLLKVAHDLLGEKALALTADSPTYSRREFNEASEFCSRFKIKQIVIKSSEMEMPEFRKNPKNRCYYCKSVLFSRCLEKARELGMKYVADGSNLDDLSDERPGSIAAEELGIRKPLLEAGLTKEDIRRYSRELGLPTWDKPSYACLASRFPYGIEITERKLSAIEKLEEFIRDLGFRQVRVRDHKNIARVEIGGDEFLKFLEDGELREKVVEKAKDAGFTYVTLDMQGYRTGSMNESE